MSDEEDYDEDLYAEDPEAVDYEDDSGIYDESDSFNYGLKSKLSKYQNEAWSAAGAAAGGALIFGTPEAVVVSGVLAGSAYAGGRLSAGGVSRIKDYLSGDKDSDSKEDSSEEYTV